MKTCPRCSHEGPVEGFNRDRGRPDGRDVYCKACRALATRRWIAANPERHAASKRGHPDAERTRNLKWRVANPEVVAESKRRAKRKYKTERRGEYLVRKRLEQSARRLTGESVAYGVVLASDPCSYCGGKGGTLDHITALRHGGTNESGNLTAACRGCNSRKSTRSLLTYLLEVA